MLHLSRTVRFVVNPPGLNQPGTNGFGGAPPLRRLAPYHEMTVVCSGHVDPVIGYLINIKAIDEAVREVALPRITSAVWAPTDDRAASDPAWILSDLLESVNRALDADLVSLRWHVTPFASYEMSAMSPDRVTLRSRFDFSASHRLFVKEWSDEKNREVFGKCAHPSGHGHNYELEPCISLPADDPIHAASELIEELVKEAIIDRFDHKHLNLDTAEFGESGVNSTVENIARVCFELLKPVLARDIPAAKLEAVTVWETPRTSAIYSA